MLMAHPAVLRNLVEHYEALAALSRSDIAGPHVHRQMQDTAYTLCVSTGTRDIESALASARLRLEAEEAVAPGASVVSAPAEPPSAAAA